MLEFLTDNIATIIILAVVVSLVILALIKVLKDRKKGPSCGGGCSGCEFSSACNIKEKKDIK